MSNDLFAASANFVFALNVLFFVLGALSVVMLIVGGIRYVLSAGDPSAVSAAKNTIIYANIGIVLLFTGYALVNFMSRELSSAVTRTPRRSGLYLAEWAPAAVTLGVSSVSIAVLLLLRRSSRGLRWIARYSAFWMPVDERVRRMSERWCLLRDAGFGLRLWFALALVVASPITGWRCRRSRKSEDFKVSVELDLLA